MLFDTPQLIPLLYLYANDIVALNELLMNPLNPFLFRAKLFGFFSVGCLLLFLLEKECHVCIKYMKKDSKCSGSILICFMYSLKHVDLNYLPIHSEMESITIILTYSNMC